MKSILTLFGIGFISFTMLAQPKVITVDNRPNSGANYTNLATAIADSFVNDTIYVHPSATSYGNITIINPLVIVGLGHNPANSDDGARAVVGNITFGGNATNSLITGLYINLINHTTTTDCKNIKIVNNRIANYIIGVNSAADADWVIEGNIFDSAYVNPSGANGWIIRNNIFNNTTWVIQYFNNTNSFINNIVINTTVNFAYYCTNPIVNNNIFILKGTINDVGLTNSTITFNNNLTWNEQGFTVNLLSGSSNLNNTNPQFVSAPFATINDFYNNNYDLAGGSAANNAGTDGTDLGVFGANFNFDTNGRPDLWPYMTSLTITNTSVPSGQDINVEFTAQKKN